jgi:hypothetical protein
MDHINPMTLETYKARAKELGVDRKCLSDDRQFNYWELTTLSTVKQRKANQPVNNTMKVTAKSLGLFEDLSHYNSKGKR